MNVREALIEILSKGTSIDVVTNNMGNEDLQDLSMALELLQKAKFIDPKKQKENRMKAVKQGNTNAMEESGLDKEVNQKVEKPKKPSSHLTVIKGEEVVKYDKLGQWSIEKAIKPGPTLDYSQINAKPNYKEMEDNASTIDYTDKKNVEIKKPWAGAAARTQRARDSINEKNNRSALDEIKARQEHKKKYGI